MLIGIGGVEPHEEDGWLGRRVRVGESLVELRGNVGRCAITTQNPETGVRDFDTLREIRGYRGQNAETREIDFGVFGEVVEPGRGEVGGPVQPAQRQGTSRPAPRPLDPPHNPVPPDPTPAWAAATGAPGPPSPRP